MHPGKKTWLKFEFFLLFLAAFPLKKIIYYVVDVNFFVILFL
jgi:hypothetical protein